MKASYYQYNISESVWLQMKPKLPEQRGQCLDNQIQHTFYQYSILDIANRDTIEKSFTRLRKMG